MKKKKFGATDREVTTFGVGCASLGQLRDLEAPEPRKADEAIETVRVATELGINYFDTSPVYKRGQSEHFLGLGLRELEPEVRKGLCVSTKVGTHIERSKQYDRDSVMWSFERSLKQLHSDAVEIVYIHDPVDQGHMDEALGRDGAVQALELLKSSGVIQAIGLGVRSHRFLRQAVADGRFDVILTPYDYSPIRDTAGGLIDEAHEKRVGVVNASPYLYGLLAGGDPAEVAKIRKIDPDELARARIIWLWCRDRGINVAALAMQFSVRNSKVSATLAGPRDAKELKENFFAATEILDDAVFDDLAKLVRTLGPPPPGGEIM